MFPFEAQNRDERKPNVSSHVHVDQEPRAILDDVINLTFSKDKWINGFR